MGKKEKVIKILEKGMVEAKKGYKAVKKYGPGVHRGLGRVAESIQTGLGPSPGMMRKMPVKQDVYYKIPKMKRIKKRAKGKMVRASRKVTRNVNRAQVDFENLAVKR